MKCFAFSFKCAAVIAAIVVAVSTTKGEQKGLLILQCGSDWCESGEDVRKVFEGGAFRGVCPHPFFAGDMPKFPQTTIRSRH